MLQTLVNYGLVRCDGARNHALNGEKRPVSFDGGDPSSI
jgi:hypothetical protein